MEMEIQENRDDKWYDEFHKRLVERAKQDEICQKDTKEATKLLVMFERLEMSDYKRRIIEDWVACLLSAAERQMEIAYDMGREEAEK